MSTLPGDISPLIDLTRRQMVGPERTSHPLYVDLVPPCNDACPAGENIQGWLAQAQAGRFQKAGEVLIRDNPFPAIHGRVCYHPCHPCESSCILNSVGKSLNPHEKSAVLRFVRKCVKHRCSTPINGSLRARSRTLQLAKV